MAKRTLVLVAFVLFISPLQAFAAQNAQASWLAVEQAFCGIPSLEADAVSEARQSRVESEIGRATDLLTQVLFEEFVKNPGKPSLSSQDGERVLASFVCVSSLYRSGVALIEDDGEPAFKGPVVSLIKRLLIPIQQIRSVLKTTPRPEISDYHRLATYLEARSTTLSPMEAIELIDRLKSPTAEQKAHVLSYAFQELSPYKGSRREAGSPYQDRKREPDGSGRAAFHGGSRVEKLGPVRSPRLRPEADESQRAIRIDSSHS